MSGHRPHVAGRVDRLSVAARATVHVLSRLALITQSVHAGLAGRGLTVRLLAVPDASSGTTLAGLVGADDVVVLLDELEDAAAVRWAGEVVGSCPTRWLVLTSQPRGPTWGALLDSGARAVMSSSSSLATVEAAILTLLDGGEVMDVGAREELLLEWEKVVDDRQRLGIRLGLLSPHERVVLEMLCDGVRVPAIAERTGVAEGTVRTQVKSVLRKLEVNSQLSAVAALHRLRELDPDWGGSPPRVPTQRSTRDAGAAWPLRAKPVELAPGPTSRSGSWCP